MSVKHNLHPMLHPLGLRNDHKDIMRLIEQQLQVIHAEAREKGYVSTNTQRSEVEDKVVTFAHITMISEGSPASIAVRG